MSMSQTDTRVRPSAWWYLLTVVLWIGSFVVFIVAIKPIISIYNAGVDQVQNNAQLSVTSDGFTAYASESSPNAVCTLANDGGSVTLDTFDSDSTFEFTFDNGPKVSALATTPDDLPAGTYQLSCKGVPRTAVLATGKRVDIGDIGPRLVIGIIASLLAGLIGLIVLIVLLVKRHNSKSRIRQAQAASSYGYGGYPGGGYPPGGYAPGGYPQPGAPGSEGPYSPPAAGTPGTGYGSPPAAPPSPPTPPSSDSPDNPPEQRP
jgi:hypothetical protein